MPDPSTGSGSPRVESRGDWTSYIRSRLASLRLSPAREREIAEELAQHLEDQVARARRGRRDARRGGAHGEDRVQRCPTRSPPRHTAPGALARTAAAGTVARVLARQRPHRSASRHPGTAGHAELHDRRAARAGAGHGRDDRDLLRRRRGRAPAAAVSRTGPHRRGGSARGPAWRRARGTTAIGACAARERGSHARRQTSRSGCALRASPPRTIWPGQISNRSSRRWRPSAASATTSFNLRAPNRSS